MVFGSGSYGSVEYSGELGPLTITGTCATTESGESSLGQASVPFTRPVLAGSGGMPKPRKEIRWPEPKEKKSVIEGSCRTTQAAGSTRADGKVKYRYRIEVGTLSGAGNTHGVGMVDDTIPTEDEEFATILSLLE